MKRFAVETNICGEDIKRLRLRLGYTQAELAALFHVSVKTLETWEYKNKELTGAVCTLFWILWENPQLAEDLEIPPKVYPLRLWYWKREQLCTIIDVDERLRKLAVRNYTGDYLSRAFGKAEKPTFTDYEEFLESRCFPRERDKMKIILKELELPFYDPLLIIEKTGGRMAEDPFWIRVER